MLAFCVYVVCPPTPIWFIHESELKAFVCFFCSCPKHLSELFDDDASSDEWPTFVAGPSAAPSPHSGSEAAVQLELDEGQGDLVDEEGDVDGDESDLQAESAQSDDEESDGFELENTEMVQLEDEEDNEDLFDQVDGPDCGSRPRPRPQSDVDSAVDGTSDSEITADEVLFRDSDPYSPPTSATSPRFDVWPASTSSASPNALYASVSPSSSRGIDAILASSHMDQLLSPLSLYSSPQKQPSVPMAAWQSSPALGTRATPSASSFGAMFTASSSESPSLGLPSRLLPSVSSEASLSSGSSEDRDNELFYSEDHDDVDQPSQGILWSEASHVPSMIGFGATQQAWTTASIDPRNVQMVREQSQPASASINDEPDEASSLILSQLLKRLLPRTGIKQQAPAQSTQPPKQSADHRIALLELMRSIDGGPTATVSKPSQKSSSRRPASATTGRRRADHDDAMTISTENRSLAALFSTFRASLSAPASAPVAPASASPARPKNTSTRGNGDTAPLHMGLAVTGLSPASLLHAERARLAELHARLLNLSTRFSRSGDSASVHGKSK